MIINNSTVVSQLASYLFLLAIASKLACQWLLAVYVVNDIIIMTIVTKCKMYKAEVWYKVLENHFECNDMWMEPHNSLY